MPSGEKQSGREVAMPQFELSRDGVLAAVTKAVHVHVTTERRHKRMFALPALNNYEFNRMHELVEAGRTELRHILGVLDMVAPYGEGDGSWDQYISDQAAAQLGGVGPAE